MYLTGTEKHEVNEQQQQSGENFNSTLLWKKIFY